MKQNEFLEIIEQNKGKHRQPIEVLVLGRRIGGIVGGGDTPEETRYLAISRNSVSESVLPAILRGKQVNFLCSREHAPNTLLVTYPDGMLRTYEGGVISQEQFNQVIRPRLTAAGIEVERWSTENLEQTVPLNTVMPNWDNYQYVPRL